VTLGCAHDVAWLGPADTADPSEVCELICRCGARLVAPDALAAHRVHQVHTAAAAVRA
jgi:hypothetical protein